MRRCLTFAVSTALVFASTVFIRSAELPPVSPKRVESINQVLGRLHEAGEFTGCVLVARDGEVLYRQAFAGSPRLAASLLNQPRNIASLAKGFTAMAVMRLKEQGKLSFDDPAAKFLPMLSPANDAITIRHLLSHTSGIPDVGDLGIDHPHLTESEVMRAVRQRHADFDPPGTRYRYSNTGYVILAMIVERASDRPFGDFLRTEILRPLGMNDTSLDAAASAAGRTKGDSAMKSTLTDLLRWSEALRPGRLVSAATLSEAFTPAPVREGQTTYGFGWNIVERDGMRYIWHTGNSGGIRAFIGRWLGEQPVSIIILTDGDSRRTEIADAIFAILHERPYVMPKLALHRRMLPVLERDGIGPAVELYRSLKASQREVYDFSERELNTLGYMMLERRRTRDAIRVFQLNAEAYPSSSNAFDSLAEAYQRDGQRELAIRGYQRALELDPRNLNARRKLQELKP